MLGVGVGHEVARPRVGELVADDAHLRPIAREQRRGHEGEPRVLHAAVRERRRHHQHVEAIPRVGSEEGLAGVDHRLDALELPRRGLHHGRLGPHPRARSELHRGELTDGEGEEVRCDGLRHRPLLHGAVTGHVATHEGRRHEPAQRRRNVERSAKRDAPLRRVLQRKHRPRVDRLALREQERVRAARGLRSVEPLQCARVGGRAVGDGDRRRRRGELEGEARAEHRLLGVQDEGHGAPFGVDDGAHVEVPGVEVQRTAPRRRKVQRHRRVERARREVHARLPRERGHLRVLVIGVRVRVDACHASAGLPDLRRTPRNFSERRASHHR